MVLVVVEEGVDDGSDHLEEVDVEGVIFLGYWEFPGLSVHPVTAYPMVAGVTEAIH